MNAFIKTSIVLSVLFSSLAIAADEPVPGSVVGRHIYGLAKDYQGDPLLVSDKPLIHTASNFSTFVDVDKTKFLLSSFSDDIGSVYLTDIEADSDKPQDTNAVNLASIGGLSHPVSGVNTLWNSVLMSENT
ncbi:MAG: hypothetical protein R3240_08855, partial [Gammaproteobacteria bacterium]|nr:hypothetical protein [Gammaproteobacteria bacterium]